MNRRVIEWRRVILDGDKLVFDSASLEAHCRLCGYRERQLANGKREIIERLPVPSEETER